jgi:hypothetical protein
VVLLGCCGGGEPAVAVLTGRGQPVPWQLLPVLAGWAELDQREMAADISPGHPILIDPELHIDPVLGRFLTASRFTWLAEGTREAYAKDYRLFFSFLWQLGKYWQGGPGRPAGLGIVAAPRPAGPEDRRLQADGTARRPGH